LNSIIIIDDDDQLRNSFIKLLSEEGYMAFGAASGEAGINIVKKEIPDLVILDMRLPGMNGLETFRAIHKIEPKLPVIIMTAFGSTENAIEATKLGAFDYILKPFDIPDMLTLVKQAIRASLFMRSPVEMDSIPDNASRDAIIGRSTKMQDVYKSIGRVSQTDATALIRGESGTGKELVVRAIYQHSLRAGFEDHFQFFARFVIFGVQALVNHQDKAERPHHADDQSIQQSQRLRRVGAGRAVGVGRRQQSHQHTGKEQRAVQSIGHGEKVNGSREGARFIFQ